MGFCYGLKFDVKIKPEYVDAIRELEALRPFTDYDPNKGESPWSIVGGKHNIRVFRVFGATWGSHNIPFGGEYPVITGHDWSEVGHHFDPESGRWCVQCGMKHAVGTISWFLSYVLPHIADCGEDHEIIVQNEEQPQPKQYRYNNSNLLPYDYDKIELPCPPQWVR